jgi:predicted transcriptional regulator
LQKAKNKNRANPMMSPDINPLINNPCKIQLLETIEKGQKNQSLFSIAMAAGIPYATAHRQLYCLANQGLVAVESQGAGSRLKIQIRERC